MLAAAGAALAMPVKLLAGRKEPVDNPCPTHAIEPELLPVFVEGLTADGILHGRLGRWSGMPGDAEFTSERVYIAHQQPEAAAEQHRIPAGSILVARRVGHWRGLAIMVVNWRAPFIRYDDTTNKIQFTYDEVGDELNRRAGSVSTQVSLTPYPDTPRTPARPRHG
jgi:hypothetical protein